MSDKINYLLFYEGLPYVGEHPYKHDKKVILSACPDASFTDCGCHHYVDTHNLRWGLEIDTLKQLFADGIFESRENGMFQIKELIK
jgi:hypothetical protein